MSNLISRLSKLRFLFVGMTIIYCCGVTACSSSSETRMAERALASQTAAAVGGHLAVLDRLNRGKVRQAKTIVEIQFSGGVVALDEFRKRNVLNENEIKVLEMARGYQAKKKHPNTE